MAGDLMTWQNGSSIRGVASAANQVRQYHPAFLILDEAAFLPEAEQSYNAADPVASQIIAASSAAPSWFGNVCTRILEGWEIGEAYPACLRREKLPVQIPAPRALSSRMRRARLTDNSGFAPRENPPEVTDDEMEAMLSEAERREPGGKTRPSQDTDSMAVGGPGYKKPSRSCHIDGTIDPLSNSSHRIK